MNRVELRVDGPIIYHPDSLLGRLDLMVNTLWLYPFYEEERNRWAQLDEDFWWMWLGVESECGKDPRGLCWLL